jgi:hypothetical protein
MSNHHLSRPGATRTGMMDSRRFNPYGTYSARPSMYGDAEAAPSAQTLPLFPYDTRPTIGGISETTADAEQTQTITEGDETPVGDSYRSPIPRVTNCSFDIRYLGLGAPTVTGHHAPAASGTRRMYASCGHGRKRRESSQGSPATKTH